MSDDTINRWLAIAIFVVLVLILVTPLFIKKAPPAFTQMPTLRVDYLENRTVYDVQSSISDYYYSKMCSSITWSNGTSIERQDSTLKDVYLITGETHQLTFNLTVTVTDLSGDQFKYMGDVNISKILYNNHDYVYLNITEHRLDWPNKMINIIGDNLPYRTSLDLIKEGNRL